MASKQQGQRDPQHWSELSYEEYREDLSNPNGELESIKSYLCDIRRLTRFAAVRRNPLAIVVFQTIWTHQYAGVVNRKRKGPEVCFASQETIARELGLDIRAVRKAFRILRDIGAIACRRRGRNKVMWTVMVRVGETPEEALERNGIAPVDNSRKPIPDRSARACHNQDDRSARACQDADDRSARTYRSSSKKCKGQKEVSGSGAAAANAVDKSTPNPNPKPPRETARADKTEAPASELQPGGRRRKPRSEVSQNPDQLNARVFTVHEGGAPRQDPFAAQRAADHERHLAQRAAAERQAGKAVAVNG